MGGEQRWVGECWWFALAHVCLRWRNVILGSPFYLGVSLLCIKGTPVADKLVHLPPLPLMIDHFREFYNITVEDEERTNLALKQRDRVRRVCLLVPSLNLKRLIVAMGEEYPILECLVIAHRTEIEGGSTSLVFPEAFQAPHLRRLVLNGFALSIGSRLLTTAVGLVALCLIMDHPSTYFHPNTLLQWLSSMPQLETLTIYFLSAVPNRDVEGQLMHTPIITPVTLPNFHHLRFRGVGAYLDAVNHRITTPCPEKLEIYFFNQLTFSVPRLQQFINSTENLRFENARFKFSDERVGLEASPRGEVEMYALSINVDVRHLDWQVSFVAQISNPLIQVFSEVEHLTLGHVVHCQSSEEHNEVDLTEWRKLLRPFISAKTIRIDNKLVEELSRCLELDDGGLSPKLQELTYFRSANGSDAFTSFIDARQNAGLPVTLVRSPSRDFIYIPRERSSMAPSSSRARNDFDTESGFYT